MNTSTTDPLSELEAWAKTPGNRFEIKTDYRGEYRVTMSGAKGCGVVVVEYPNGYIDRNIEAWYHAWLVASPVYAATPEDRSEALRPGLRGCVSLALTKMAELEMRAK